VHTPTTRAQFGQVPQRSGVTDASQNLRGRLERSVRLPPPIPSEGFYRSSQLCQPRIHRFTHPHQIFEIHEESGRIILSPSHLAEQKFTARRTRLRYQSRAVIGIGQIHPAASIHKGVPSAHHLIHLGQTRWKRARP
jgi:hypothetical protein